MIIPKNSTSHLERGLVSILDGQIIAVATSNTVRLWQKNRKLLHTLKGHDPSVMSVLFSPDGQTITSRSDRKTVQLWSRDGKLLHTLKGHDPSVVSVVSSPDGQTIASGSDDQTVKLWSLNGKLINTLKGHDNSVSSVVFSPDGQTIASGSDDQTVKLWSRDGKLLNTLKEHDADVLSVVFSPDGQTIASGSSDKTIKVWSLDGKLINTLKGHDNSVSSVVFSPDGQTIASGSEDKTVKLWNAWEWNNDDYFTMGCYWLKDLPDYSNFKNDCDPLQKRIPKLLISQALATATTGNYSAAAHLLQDAKQRDPSLNITPHLRTARQSARQSLINQANLRSTITDLKDLSEDPAIAKANFTSLTRSRLAEATFLIRRAKSINPELNLDAELKKNEEKWKEGIEELRMVNVELKN